MPERDPRLSPWAQARFRALLAETQAVIAQCGYARVYCAVACEVFPEAVPADSVVPIKTTALPAETESTCARLCHGLRYAYLDAIDTFGYEAVYFGVGVAAFPEAVDPWEGNDY